MIFESLNLVMFKVSKTTENFSYTAQKVLFLNTSNTITCH